MINSEALPRPSIGTGREEDGNFAGMRAAADGNPTLLASAIFDRRVHAK
jgi:hypothetical protein